MKKIRICSLLLLSSIISSTVFAQDLKFKNCKDSEELEIVRVLDLTRVELPLFIKKIQSYANKNRKISSFTNRQFKLAIKNLKCANKKINSMKKYICKSDDDEFSRKAEGMVRRIEVPYLSFMPGINLAGVYLGYNFFYISGQSRQIVTIIHELSHKCGAEDGDTYFVEEGVNPNQQNLSKRRWGNLSPIYDWWHKYGMCIPKLNC